MKQKNKQTEKCKWKLQFVYLMLNLIDIIRVFYSVQIIVYISLIKIMKSKLWIHYFHILPISVQIQSKLSMLFPLALTIHFISWLLIKTNLCYIFVKWFSLGTWYTSCSVKKLKLYKYYFQFYGRKALKGSCLMA